MLMNNLDPDVAERPDELVVYGGTGRAARSWEAFERLLRTLRTLADDETMLVQSGEARGRVPDARVGAAGADRELQPRGRVGHLGRVPPARGARADDVRPDDGGLVDLHRQPGDRAGHLRVLCGDRPPALRRLAGRHGHHRRPRRDGRGPAARGDDERGVALCVEVDRDRIRRRLETRYLDEEADDLADAVERCLRQAGGAR